MFTGIIRHEGRLRERAGKKLDILCPTLASELAPGESVAVNGVCLTVAQLGSDGFSADLLDETLAITTLGKLTPGSRLNLEPALRAGDSMGGHMLSGHVETTARVREKVWRNSGDCELTVTIPEELNRYMLSKGSIAIDGVSLTIQQLARNELTVMLIPETTRASNLGELEAGDSVNIESDMFTRAVHHSVERILAAKEEGQQRNE